ncbi:MAG: hypothetical protein JNM76_11785 [Betaproteobacteria bacterium]|nr:hypothetical protein [Betaproteobacteria bacterium]
MQSRTLRIFALAAMLPFLAACGKSEPPAKSAEQLKAEKDAATKASRENPVYGNQLQAYDKAKELADQANKQAEETKKKIDEQTK